MIYFVLALRNGIHHKPYFVMIAIENELNGCNNDGKSVGKYLAIDTTK